MILRDNLTTKLTKYLTIFAMLVILLLPAFSLDTFWSVENTDTIAEQMSDEELILQVLLLSYYGSETPSYFENWIKESGLGGFKLFGWNSDEPLIMAEEICQLQSWSQQNRFEIPLFIATDQEGGWVRHLTDGTIESPGNMAIGAVNKLQAAYETGEILGSELNAIGINMNFAPTVDLLQSADAHVVGTRAFNDNPVNSAILATAYIKGMEKYNVLSTAKHFPGHGNASSDSHGEVTEIPLTLDELEANELYVYKYLINEDIPAVMAGHIAFPNITGEVIPASISSYFLNDILRDELGFKGLIVTDDMVMRGVRINNYSIPELAELALRAGNDLLLISLNEDVHKNVKSYLLEIMKNDPQFKEIVLTAVKRILEYKRKYIPYSEELFTPSEENLAKLNSDENQQVILQHSASSITLKKGELPLSPDNSPMLIVTPYKSLYESIKTFIPESDLFYYEYYPFYSVDNETKARLASIADNYKSVLFFFTSPKSSLLFESLENYSGEKYAVALLNPYYLPDIDELDLVLYSYSGNDRTREVVTAVLRGDIEAEGHFPLERY